jgi:GNAT superfamily N-acetyltransferase
VTSVAVNGNAICGFATVAPAAESDAPGCGELAALYVAPEHWRSGVGSALLAVVRRQLLVFGHRQAILWVLVGNAPAEKFYERDGWVKDSAQRVVTLWGVTVEEQRFRHELMDAGR